ncbi:MAG: Na/Pi cotransporter family protein [Bdellovibrionaceae bacterium]|nr:Na/Pi cotransporter family protein [Bdellovibrionales bacterium]MCB9084930.1 Na/Pi cotransporter family protein [Pseudobdellovibrionaceae bacterium]
MSSPEILFILVFSLAAALGLTLMGLRFLSDSLQVLAEPLLRRLVNGIHHNSFVAYGSGLLTAFFVQSGLSTSVMSIGFANSGLLNLPKLYFFLTGVQLGTAATPLLFGFNTGLLDIYFLGIGVFPMLYARWGTLANVGKLVFAFGLLLLSTRLVHFGVVNPEWVRDMAGNWLVESHLSPKIFLVTAGLAGLCSVFIRSSVALAAIVAVMANLSLISPELAVVFLAGASWTSVFPALWAARDANTISRRGSAGLAINYLTGLLLLYGFFELFWACTESVASLLGSGLPSEALKVVVGFGLYRVFLSLYGVLVSGIILRLVKRVIPDRYRKESQRLVFNGLPHHLPPALALTQARQEVQKLAAMTETILQLTKVEIEGEGKDSDSRDKVLKYEAITDNIQREVFEFLGQVIRVSLTQKQGEEARRLLKVADELESIADCCQRLVSSHQRLVLDEPLDVELRLALRQYMESVMETFEYVFHLLIGPRLSHEKEEEELWPQFRDKTARAEKNSHRLLGLLGTMSGQSEDLVQMGEIVHLLRQINKHSYNLMVAI